MYLDCECGNQTFVQVMRLRQHSTGSQVAEVAGFQCAKCNKPAILHEILKRQELEKRKAEYERLKKEMESAKSEEKPRKTVKAAANG